MEGLFTAAALTLAASLAFILRRGKMVNILLAFSGDEDMKIASPGSFSPSAPEDSADLAAKQFLHQRELGNIQKARELGIQYAQMILDRPEELFPSSDLDDLVNHHRLLLYSYAVNRVISESSPNSILAQTSQNVFYSTLETSSLELYRHVSDTAAFSLYILCERSDTRSDDEIGKVFADLCGRPDDLAVIEEGNKLYQSYYSHCSALFKSAGYI